MRGAVNGSEDCAVRSDHCGCEWSNWRVVGALITAGTNWALAVRRERVEGCREKRNRAIELIRASREIVAELLAAEMATKISLEKKRWYSADVHLTMLITRLLVEEGLKAYSSSGTYVRDVYLCLTEVFYPYAYGEEFHPSCMTPETLAVHFWSKSWETDVPRWVRTAKAVRKHLRTLGRCVSLPLGTRA